MTRQEHMDWCKQRALQYVEAGDIQVAFASMASDIMKHEDTKHHAGTNQLGMQLMMSGHLASQQQMREWINGYN
jgi:hypothetical protein